MVRIFAGHERQCCAGRSRPRSLEYQGISKLAFFIPPGRKILTFIEKDCKKMRLKLRRIFCRIMGGSYMAVKTKLCPLRYH